MIHNLGSSTRLIRSGVFKIGEKRVGKNGKEYPVALDHFRVVGGEEGVYAVWGQQPKRVLIYLPEDSPRTWDAFYKRYAASGLVCKGDGEVGREIKGQEIIERPCANRNCPYAQPEGNNAPRCRPVGTLIFRVVGVNSVGAYAYDFRGLRAVEEAHAFLSLLRQAAGGDLSGVPFAMEVVRERGRDGQVISRTRLSEAQETSQAIADPSLRLRQPAPAERVTNAVIVDEATGEVIASPQVPEGEPLEARSRFAVALNRAIAAGYIVGKAKQKYLGNLMSLASLSEAEAAERLRKLEDWMAAFEASADEPVKRHPEDMALAEWVHARLNEEDYEALGIIPAETPGELTRMEVRRAYQHLEARAVGA